MKLQKGKKYSYPSGLGGRFAVVYTKYDKDTKRHIFRVTNPGFEGMELTLTSNDMSDLKRRV